MTPDELSRLLAVAGRDRAILYKTLLLTGLRKGELASITLSHVHLDGPVPCVELLARDEKNGQGASIMLRHDLARDLRTWLDEKLVALQKEAHRRGAPIPARLPADTPLFHIPSTLIRQFDRDLRLANIAKRDDRGRTVDVHALRITFISILLGRGASLREVQLAARHSTPTLTAGTYSDPRAMNVAGALGLLPDLPLDSPPTGGQERARSTGTHGSPALHSVASDVARTFGTPGQHLANGGNLEPETLASCLPLSRMTFLAI